MECGVRDFSGAPGEVDVVGRRVSCRVFVAVTVRRFTRHGQVRLDHRIVFVPGLSYARDGSSQPRGDGFHPDRLGGDLFAHAARSTEVLS